MASTESAGTQPPRFARAIFLSAVGILDAVCATRVVARDAAPSLPLEHVADVALGGRPTRVDYESFDPTRHLLFIAHLGDSAVIAFDTQSRRVVGRVSGVGSVHGVLAVPSVGAVYATATGTNEVIVIDERTLRITARSPAGTYPDGLTYAPDAGKLYVSDAHGGTVTVIDTKSSRRLGAISIGGEIGNTQYDRTTRHIFSNAQSHRELVEIDPATDAIVRRIPLPGADGNHGLLIDPEERLAFIACEGNRLLLVVELTAGSVRQRFDVGEDPDVLAYDPQLHLLYVASESGVGAMFRVAMGSLTKIGESMLGPHAHVVAVDPLTSLSYWPLANAGGQPVLRIMKPRSVVIDR